MPFHSVLAAAIEALALRYGSHWVQPGDDVPA
jgi:hypothetical protein